MTRGVTRRPLVGLLIPAAVAVLFIALPLIGLLVHVDWSNLPSQLVSSDLLTALRLSLECSVIAVAVSLIIGVPLAYLLARTSLPGRRVIRGLVTLPLVLPPVLPLVPFAALPVPLPPRSARCVPVLFRRPLQSGSAFCLRSGRIGALLARL